MKTIEQLRWAFQNDELSDEDVQELFKVAEHWRDLAQSLELVIRATAKEEEK